MSLTKILLIAVVFFSLGTHKCGVDRLIVGYNGGFSLHGYFFDSQ